jgi:hypothetical protein
MSELDDAYDTAELTALRADAERLTRELGKSFVTIEETIRRAEQAERERDEAIAENATLRAERDLWEAKAKELIAPHYILDPDLRAAKFRDALAFHPVIFVRAALRAELLKATGSLGLLTAGANPKAEGHKANLESARNILCATATPDELVCPTCKSARWAEIHPSKSDPTGYTLYCRRCEEGCVTPARAALGKESP